MPSISPELMLLIGLGVGVDYALFIVTRHRQGLVAGRDSSRSIINAVNTSGRAVLFAGIIVCIALLGMFALGVSFLYGLAVAAAIGVALTMIAALTLAARHAGLHRPQGDEPQAEAEPGRERAAHRRRRQQGLLAELGRPGAALPVGRGRSRRSSSSSSSPCPSSRSRLGSADQGTDPAGTPTRVAFDMLSKGFGPGYNGPLMLVGRRAARPAAASSTTSSTTVSQQPDVAQGGATLLHPEQDGHGDVVLRQRLPRLGAAGRQHHRPGEPPADRHVPQAEGDSGVKVLVGGTTAIYIDFANVLERQAAALRRPSW